MGVLDAWAYNLPVVTTPVGGIPDVAIDNENIMLFNPGDIESLASRLESLMNDAELRNRMSEASRAFSNGRFSIPNITNQLNEIYHSLG